jgi:hypothetical protein
MMEILNLIFAPLVDLGKWVIKNFLKPDPVLVLKRREEFRNEFESKLPRKNQYGIHCEAIIRDIKRMDSYPDIDTAKKGISPWFKVEVKGLYHRGVEVFISMPEYIKRDKGGGWKFTDHKDAEEKVLAYPVGRIPFDLIEYINWDGDEYYPFPHIYCRFKAFKGQPYESIPFFAKHEGSEYFFEVDGFRPWDKKRGIWFLKFKKEFAAKEQNL